MKIQQLSLSSVRNLSLSIAALLFGITALAFIIRAGYAFNAVEIDPILRRDSLFGDASGYHLLALNLMQGQGFSWDGEMPTSYRMPGYPVFLAAVYELSGTSHLAVRLLHAVFGALLCIPVFLIALNMGGKPAAVLSSLGVAFHPVLIYMTGWIYSESLFLLLLWLGVWLTTRMLTGGGVKEAVFAGFAFGLATYVRPEIVVFPLFVFGLAFLLRWKPRQLGLMLAVQVILGVLILPWTVRNTLVHHAFVPLTTSSGSNLYAGNNPDSQGGSAWTYPIEGVSELDSDRILGQRAREYITQNPDKIAPLMLAKVFKFFSPAEMETRDSVLGRWNGLINAAYVVFLLVAAFGAIANRYQMPVILLSALIAWYLITALIFYGGTRVALPVVPALVILASLGVERIRSRIQVGQLQR